MAERSDLRDRTKTFALRVIKLVQSLPRTTDARALGGQVVRSGTSIGANYRSALRARSRAEFKAKLGIVLEEADETCYWLELIMDGKIMKESRIRDLHQEAQELTAIFAQMSITTRKSN